MKKIFVSLPTRGIPIPKLLKQFHALSHEATYEVIALNPDEEAQALDRPITQLLNINGENTWVYFIGDVIIKLSSADYAIFAWNWKTSEECQTEHNIAKGRGIEILYQNKSTEANT